MINKILSFSVFLTFMFMGFAVNAQDEELGIASYYGDEFHGRKTAYGDVYDKTKMTCAHKRHPYGTKLKVTRIDNKKSVTVKVTDKGPFVKGRIVDLSRVAAQKIGLVQDGVAEVKIEVVGKSAREDVAAVVKKKEKVVTEKPKEYNAKPVEQKADIVKREDIQKILTKAKADTKETVAKASPASKQTSTVTAKDGAYIEKALFKIGEGTATQTYGVQVASLKDYDNAAKEIAKLKGRWFDDIILLAEPMGKGVTYRVVLGPFASEKKAASYQRSLAKNKKMEGFVMKLPMETQLAAKGKAPVSAPTKAVVLSAPAVGDYGVQVASLTSFEGALYQIETYKKKWFKNILLKMEGGKYKVILGPQKDAASAKNYKNSLAKNHKVKGFVVKLGE